MDWIPPHRPHKGRAAISSRTARYESLQRVAIDDGWGDESRDGWGGESHGGRGDVSHDGRSDESHDGRGDETHGGRGDSSHDGRGDGGRYRPDDDTLPPLRTTVDIDRAQRIIATNQSPDVPFDRSINPYQGCEHGCIYCFARPTHAYYGLSPGLDFETKLFQKPDAPALLDRELRRTRYRPAVIALGANTDPYQPIERGLKLTRRILQVLADFNHPVAIITKSPLVTRDIDILAPMAARQLAMVTLSITTLDRSLARRMEPRAATPAKRLDAIRTLSAVGIPVSVLAAPMIPALNDAELEAILAAAAKAGACSAGYTLLRLPLEIRDLFVEWLAANNPERASHVMSLVRATRGGADYDSRWGLRRTGTGVYADLLAARFRLARRKSGLDKRSLDLDTSRFCPPPMKGDQLTLFG
jgi:DNA repair photolyase